MSDQYWLWVPVYAGYRCAQPSLRDVQLSQTLANAIQHISLNRTPTQRRCIRYATNYFALGLAPLAAFDGKRELMAGFAAAHG